MATLPDPGLLRDLPPPYATVVFDCDSTLSAIEGIEELGVGDAEIERLTREAMEGGVALEDVFARRLERVRPSRADLERIGRRYVETLVPGAGALVRALRSLGKRVCIVSGGLLPAVAFLARELGIVAQDVHAVAVRFDAAGAYAGFDQGSPLARSGGKRVVLGALREKGAPLAFVGDGITDLEAADLSERFVAFGGVERREAVLAGARVRCLDPDFRALVPLLLSSTEIATLGASPDHRPLIAPPRGPVPPTA